MTTCIKIFIQRWKTNSCIQRKSKKGSGRRQREKEREKKKRERERFKPYK